MNTTTTTDTHPGHNDYIICPSCYAYGEKGILTTSRHMTNPAKDEYTCKKCNNHFTRLDATVFYPGALNDSQIERIKKIIAE